jgi:hypothetical protein
MENGSPWITFGWGLLGILMLAGCIGVLLVWLRVL